VELSWKSEYALLALLELVARHPEGEPLQTRHISSPQNIPDRYLEQLLATLRRDGLVRSQRGAKGGYFLAKEPQEISLFQVLSCLEGLEPRAIQPQTATLEAVVIDELWQEVVQASHAVLHRYTLQDLSDRIQAKRQIDLMYYI